MIASRHEYHVLQRATAFRIACSSSKGIAANSNGKQGGINGLVLLGITIDISFHDKGVITLFEGNSLVEYHLRFSSSVSLA